jgi:hypothetical protein
MHEIPRLLGTSRENRKIIVQTRAGTNLDNFIGPDASGVCVNRFELLRRKHLGWEVRKPPTGGYNCAGMVWASRRTALPAPDDWSRVLIEDGYRQLSSSEAPRLGDLAVYFSHRSNRIMHIGRVCRIDRITQESRALPRILSKLDLTLGEVIHAVDDIVLDGGDPFDVRLYTDRAL